MSAILLTGAAGAGKTQVAVARIKSALDRTLFGKIWVLLPTELQVSTFRSRLLREIGDMAHFGVEFFNFYDLYARLLEMAETPQRRVKDAARFRILRHVLHEEVGSHLTHFRAISQMPGFVALAADFITELKQAQITPEDFVAAARITKDDDLALIYSGYQSFLREHNLVDRDGEGWLALARLEETPTFPLNVELLVVDGYDQFNPVQARLLALLAERIPDTLLTLTYQPQRADTAHRRFAQTRDRLLEYGAWTEMALDGDHPARSESLDHLSTRLFDIRPLALPDDDSVTLLEAPDRQRETLTILRRIKRLLLSGVQPDQIAIIARDVEPYTPYFLETASAYGIPLATRRGARLGENPAVAAFLSLIDIHVDFRRRPVIDALYSPYLHCPDLSSWQIDRLEAISRGRIVVRGRQNWLDAILMAGHLPEDDEAERPFDAITPEQADELRQDGARFFQRITPPRQATAREFVRWLDALIGPDTAPDDEAPEFAAAPHFDVLQHIRSATEPNIVARDLAAIDALKRVFAEVLSAYELVDPYAPVEWDIFRLDLQIAIDNATVNMARIGNRSGRVLLASVFETRGLPHDHIFLIGLSESMFPARVSENILYTDDERRNMQKRNLPLITLAEAADESSLFYEITALARQSLTISRPYVDDRGNEWPASPYWRAVQQVLALDVERMPLASDIPLDDAARLSEAALALAQALGSKLTPAISSVHNWIIEHATLGAAWSNALRGRQVEARRGSNAMPFDAYTGRLTDPVLLERVAELLGPDRVWSASQFNEYGICPYRFFARRLLRLRELEEPEEGIDQLQLGLVYHEILEHTYRHIEHEGLAISPQNLPRALDILRQELDRLLADAPQRHGFRATALWPHEKNILQRKLEALVSSDFSPDAPISTAFADLPGPRRSVQQEVRFGDDQEVYIDGEAGPLLLRGAIDRVDVVNGRAVVIDYKSGSSPIQTQEMIEGRNVQMMVYIQAARQVLKDQDVKGATFWQLGTGKLSGTIEADNPDLEEARHTLHQRIEIGRQGIFVNLPSKRSHDGQCASYCEFRQLCRVDRTGKNKAL